MRHSHKLILGTVQFGVGYGVSNIDNKKVPKNEVEEILEFSLRKGITTLDTASAYGESESILGSIGVKKFDIITKLPNAHYNENIEKSIFEYSQRSLLRLKVNSLNGLLVHSAKSMLSNQGKDIYRSLVNLKERGLVEKIGVSAYHANEIETLIDNYDFDIIQAPFNIIDHRLIHSGLMKKMNTVGVELHARSIFLQGLLLMDKEDRPKYFRKWSRLWNMWDEWLNDLNVTAVEACLNHALSYSGVSKVLIGVESLKQLQEICNVTKKDIREIPFEISSNDPMLLNPSNWD